MIKTTYGTGSSIMMHTGHTFATPGNGLATSIAWGENGMVSYVLEGNINYTGAVITWLKDDMHLISSTDELARAVEEANPADTTVLVPAFSGLSAPYWNDHAKAMLVGMTRISGKNEIVKAALESIAFQIQDVLCAMQRDSGIAIGELRVDGGPTRNAYLMQFQSDIARVRVAVPEEEELSAIGVAYMAGIAQGLYQKEALFRQARYTYYTPQMQDATRQEKCGHWQNALRLALR